jgi:hypothetical protein
MLDLGSHIVAHRDSMYMMYNTILKHLPWFRYKHHETKYMWTQLAYHLFHVVSSFTDSMNLWLSLPSPSPLQIHGKYKKWPVSLIYFFNTSNPDAIHNVTILIAHSYSGITAKVWPLASGVQTTSAWGNSFNLNIGPWNVVYLIHNSSQNNHTSTTTKPWATSSSPLSVHDPYTIVATVPQTLDDSERFLTWTSPCGTLDWTTDRFGNFLDFLRYFKVAGWKEDVGPDPAHSWLQWGVVACKKRWGQKGRADESLKTLRGATQAAHCRIWRKKEEGLGGTSLSRL